MATREVRLVLHYDTPHSNPDSVPLINIRFNYKYQTLTFDVHRRQIVTESRHINPPISSCPIHPQLIAHHRNLSLLCNHLLNFINSCDPRLDFTTRLDLAQFIARSLISRTSPFFQVTAVVDIVHKEFSTVDGDVLILNGGGVVVGESRRRDGAGTGTGTGTGASRSAMNKLMKEGRFYYHNGAGAGTGEGEGEDQCSICWENYREGIEAIKMPCLHIFHQKCIVPWLKTKNSCPLCRQTI